MDTTGENAGHADFIYLAGGNYVAVGFVAAGHGDAIGSTSVAGSLENRQMQPEILPKMPY